MKIGDIVKHKLSHYRFGVIKKIYQHNAAGIGPYFAVVLWFNHPFLTESAPQLDYLVKVS